MSKHIRTEIIINAPKTKVWAILTNFANYAEWNPFITNIEGTLGINNRLVNTMQNGDKRFVFKPVIKKVIPEQYFDWIGNLFVKGIFDGHHFFEIEEINAGQIKLVQGENFSGILSSYLLRKIGNDTRNNFIRMNQAVKAQAEKN